MQWPLHFVAQSFLGKVTKAFCEFRAILKWKQKDGPGGNYFLIERLGFVNKIRKVVKIKSCNIRSSLSSSDTFSTEFFNAVWSEIIQDFWCPQVTMLERMNLEASKKSRRVTFPYLKLSKFSIQVQTRQRPSLWSHHACMPEVTTPASLPFASSESWTSMTSRGLVWSSWPLSWSRSSTLDTRSVWSTWHCATPNSFDCWGTRLASISPPSFHTASTFPVWVCTGMRSWLVNWTFQKNRWDGVKLIFSNFNTTVSSHEYLRFVKVYSLIFYRAMW